MSDTNKPGTGNTPDPEGETYDESGATVEGTEQVPVPVRPPSTDVPPDRRPAEG